MATEKKKKPSHGVWSNLAFVGGIMWRENRKYLVCMTVMSFMLPVIWAVLPFLNKYVMEVITSPETRMRNLAILGFLLLLRLAADILCVRCNRYNMFYGEDRGRWIFLKKLIQKRLTMDYQNVELTSLGDSFQKAVEGISSMTSISKSFRMTVANSLQVAIYTAVLAALSPFMIPVLGVPAVLNFFINRHVYGWRWRNADKWTGLDRQLTYLSSAATDFSYAKDMRLYRIPKWLEHKFQEVWGKRLHWYRELDRRMTIWKLAMQVISVLSVLASYGVVISMVGLGKIGAGDFVLYFSAISNYAGAIWDLADGLSAYHWHRDQINYYRDYLEFPDRYNHGEGRALPKEVQELTFRHVSYTYPNAKQPTINDISFTLRRGERLALVGLNGAGKSTLIKLMCGLYDATEGEILLNGINRKEFNREEYYTLFSTVFQDFDILPVTIAQNITQRLETEHDREGVSEVLKKAGLFDKIQTLPKKEDTLLAKSVYDDATDFSGGELQKLALAKALYKDAPILLLDEPTAALDAISEQEMYLQYADFSKEKASVFISHRLASTRFCDRILLIEDGRIAEQGSHEELMRFGGKYAQLYQLQSAYYVENNTDK